MWDCWDRVERTSLFIKFQTDGSFWKPDPIHNNTLGMSKISITICILTLCGLASAQTPVLFNNQAGLYIASGTQIQINGDFTNESSSSLKNNGVITISGNVTNNAPMTTADAGELRLVGTTPQTIAGIAMHATNLTISNPSGIVSTAPLKVSGQVSFMSGILKSMDPANAITFINSASISGTFPASDQSHIDGYVVREGEGTFIFPVGDNQTYQPIAVDLNENDQGIVAKYEMGNAGEGPYTATGSSTTPLVARNEQEYWTLTPITSATGSVTVFWDSNKNIGITNIEHLTVAHFANNNWQNEGGNNAVGNVTAGSVTSNVISSWSPFTLGSINIASPLPVTLVQFSARKAEQAAELSWQIADATNFSHFEIERSTDAVRFENIGNVQYSGAPNAQSSYRFTDRAIVAPLGPLYYRLRMVDQDGTYAFSKMVSLNYDSSLRFTAYPNPSRDKFTLKIDGAPSNTIEILITSADGRRVTKNQVNLTQGRAIIDTADLPAGVYLLSTNLNGIRNVIKFAKN
jgi:hypothetical protein